jgi:hypothetical protein
MKPHIRRYNGGWICYIPDPAYPSRQYPILADSRGAWVGFGVSIYGAYINWNQEE